MINYIEGPRDVQFTRHNRWAGIYKLQKVVGNLDHTLSPSRGLHGMRFEVDNSWTRCDMPWPTVSNPWLQTADRLSPVQLNTQIAGRNPSGQIPDEYYLFLLYSLSTLIHHIMPHCCHQSMIGLHWFDSLIKATSWIVVTLRFDIHDHW